MFLLKKTNRCVFFLALVLRISAQQLYSDSTQQIEYTSQDNCLGIYALPSYGQSVVLTDGSSWFVDPRNYKNTSAWSENNHIYLTENSSLSYPTLVVNSSLNDSASAISVKDYLYSCTTKEGWKKIKPSRHIGVNLSLSSIYSKKSCGIGEFYDLIPLIEWCKAVGFDVIQLLPLNDFGSDYSPYNSSSSCAISPLYLSLSELPYVWQDAELNKEIKKLNKLNASSKVQFEKVQKGKDAFLQTYYTRFSKQLQAQDSYKDFEASNAWLLPYGVFKTLKTKYKGLDHDKWNKDDTEVSQERFSVLVKENKEEIDYQVFLQYLCYLQLKEIKKIANDSIIFLLGDIPILVNKESADVWYDYKNFNNAFSVGCPPDMNSVDGQNWGFPSYDLQFMQQDGFSFWKKRLQYASNFYDIYRLDHILGFFRFWLIPVGKNASDGMFVPSVEEDALIQGTQILQTIVPFVDMLPIGEDLGVVPLGVSKALSDMGICGIRVMRWQTVPGSSQQFEDVKNYPILSLTTVSTHDVQTLKQWWIDDKQLRQNLCKQKNWPCTDIVTKAQIASILKDSFSSSSIFHINLLQEFLSLVPELSWQNPKMDRINVPGTVSKDNWSFKTKTSIEKIVGSQDLRDQILDIMKTSQVPKSVCTENKKIKP